MQYPALQGRSPKCHNRSQQCTCPVVVASTSSASIAHHMRHCKTNTPTKKNLRREMGPQCPLDRVSCGAVIPARVRSALLNEQLACTVRRKFYTNWTPPLSVLSMSFQLTVNVKERVTRAAFCRILACSQEDFSLRASLFVWTAHFSDSSAAPVLANGRIDLIDHRPSHFIRLRPLPGL